MAYKLLLVVAALKFLALVSTRLIETNHGWLMGEKVGSYYAFKSIPYAEPPTGLRRFEPPSELQRNWTSVLNATGTASKCLQLNSLKPGHPIEGSEDCLYLNIFVPAHAFENTSSFLPVVFFIHGGALNWGSADFYGEDYIMEHGGMILVTLNYRLSAFGFLSGEDNEMPGNMGLKDQALALKWVHENIPHFKGDKKKVLLSGWSAGGASVHYHMISKATKSEWFSSAVSASGTALCPCHAIYKGNALKKLKLMGEYLNCSAEARATTGDLKSCLKEISATTIMEQIPKLYKFSNKRFAIFGPVIETPSGTEFLTDHVSSLMEAGETKAKPWLFTRTKEDGAFGSAEFLRKSSNGKELIEELDQHWMEWAPVLLFFNTSWPLEQQRDLAFKLREKYFGSRPIGLKTYKKLEQLFNDELSTNHINSSVELYVKQTPGARAFGYVYDNPAPYGLGQILANREDWEFGTIHGDDIYLIFKTSIREGHPMREDEKLISKQLIETIYQMAATGLPKYNGQPLRSLDASNSFGFSVISKNGLD